MLARTIHAVTLAACIAGLAVPAAAAARVKRVPMSLTGDSDGAVLPRVLWDEPRSSTGKVVRTPRQVDPMQQIRNRMVQGAEVSFADLQALADSGDDLAAYFLAKRIDEGGKPELRKTAVHYYARAVFDGRAAAVRPMVRLLEAEGQGFDAGVLKDARLALEAQAEDNNEIAVDALVRFYIQGTPFGSDPDRAEDLLRRSAEGGNARIALDLAVQLLSGAPTPDERADALRYLELAALSDHLGVRTMAENLLRAQGVTAVASAGNALVAPVPATRKVPQ